MKTQKPLLKDKDGEEVDVHMYRSMIGSLMYLTSSRPDIMFVVCACARYQVNPKVSHLHAVKRIFKYLKGRKSTIGGCQFLRCRLISWQCKKQTMVANSTTEAEYVAASSCCGQVLWIQNQLLDYGDCNEKKLIQMVKIHTDKNVADLLTKAFDKLSFDEVKELFETTMKRVNTFTLMESGDTVPKVVAGSSKIDDEQELNQESSKRQKIGQGSELAEESQDELSQEQLQQLMIIVPEEEMNVESLQTKYPIVDWEVYTEDSRKY
ncbi:hypothetical protein Tco_0782476 [Tanacetum coccineum]